MSKKLNMAGEWKCRVVRLNFNLKDHQLKIITQVITNIYYICVSVIVIYEHHGNHKPKTYNSLSHTHTQRESNPNITLKISSNHRRAKEEGTNENYKNNQKTFNKMEISRDFPGGTVVKNPPANAGDMGSSLIQEDPTCCGATKPVHHNYWACALEPASHNYWACMPQLLKPAHLEPMLRNKRSHHNENSAHHNEEEPPLVATRESPRAAMKTQSSQK